MLCVLKDSPRGDERVIQGNFKDFCLGGEWFEPSDEILALVARANLNKLSTGIAAEYFRRGFWAGWYSGVHGLLMMLDKTDWDKKRPKHLVRVARDGDRVLPIDCPMGLSVCEAGDGTFCRGAGKTHDLAGVEHIVCHHDGN